MKGGGEGAHMSTGELAAGSGGSGRQALIFAPQLASGNCCRASGCPCISCVRCIHSSVAEQPGGQERAE